MSVRHLGAVLQNVSLLKLKNQILHLKDIEIYAPVGVYDFEKEQKNKFLVSIALEGDYTQSMLSDRLEDTLDYQEVYVIIQAAMSESADLIEHIAYRIARGIQQLDFPLHSIHIQIQKMNPPLEGKVGSSSFEIRYSL